MSDQKTHVPLAYIFASKHPTPEMEDFIAKWKNESSLRARKRVNSEFPKICLNMPPLKVL